MPNSRVAFNKPLCNLDGLGDRLFAVPQRTVPNAREPDRACRSGSNAHTNRVYGAFLSVRGRDPNWCQLVSCISTPKCLAAFLMLANAATWSKRAIALRTCDASVIGSLRFLLNAKALSGREFMQAASSLPPFLVWTGFQVASDMTACLL